MEPPENNNYESPEVKDNPIYNREVNEVLDRKLKKENIGDQNTIDNGNSNSDIVTGKMKIKRNDEGNGEEINEEANKKNASKYIPVKYSYSGGFFHKHFAEIEVQMNLAKVKNSLLKACNILKELNTGESRKNFSESDFSELDLETIFGEENSGKFVEAIYLDESNSNEES